MLIIEKKIENLNILNEYVYQNCERRHVMIISGIKISICIYLLLNAQTCANIEVNMKCFK